MELVFFGFRTDFFIFSRIDFVCAASWTGKRKHKNSWESTSKRITISFDSLPFHTCLLIVTVLTSRSADLLLHLTIGSAFVFYFLHLCSFNLNHFSQFLLSWLLFSALLCTSLFSLECTFYCCSSEQCLNNPFYSDSKRKSAA